MKKQCFLVVFFTVVLASGFAQQGQQAERLFQAAANGDAATVRQLLNGGLNVNVYDPENGWNALMYASQKGQVEIVAFLIQRGANVNMQDPIDGWTALLLASKNGYTNVARALLEKKADVNVTVTEKYSETNGFSALLFACKADNAELGALLLERGADANYTVHNDYGTWTPLGFACENGSLALVRSLLQKKADVNVETFHGFPLEFAAGRWIARANEQIALLLIENGAKYYIQRDDGRQGVFLAAAGNGMTRVVAALIARGVAVNEGDSTYGNTALMYAAAGGHVETVKLLHRNGANLNVRAGSGERETALTWAKDNRKVDVVMYLTNNGAVE